MDWSYTYAGSSPGCPTAAGLTHDGASLALRPIRGSRFGTHILHRPLPPRYLVHALGD